VDLGSELSRIRTQSRENEERAKKAREHQRNVNEREAQLNQEKVAQRTEAGLRDIENRLRKAAKTSDSIKVIELIEDDFLIPKDYKYFVDGLASYGKSIEHLVGAGLNIAKQLQLMNVKTQVKMLSYKENEGELLDEYTAYYPALVAYW